MVARLAGPFGRNLFLLLTVVFFGLPIVWLLLATTKTTDTLQSAFPLSFGSFANVGTAWSNLVSYDGGIILLWARNSVLYTVTSVVLAVLLCVPAGYGLAKFAFRGRSAVLFLTLLTMIVPQGAMILPLYLEMSAVNLTGTSWAVVLPLAFYPFGVYLVYLFAVTSMPDSILEAARIDGASELRILLSLFLPLARPTVVMVAFFAFASAWNTYFLPFIMLTNSDQATLQTGLALLINSTNALGGANFTKFPIHQPEAALATVFAVAPILLMFLFAQRYLVAGQTVGAEKG